MEKVSEINDNDVAAASGGSLEAPFFSKDYYLPLEDEFARDPYAKEIQKAKEEAQRAAEQQQTPPSRF